MNLKKELEKLNRYIGVDSHEFDNQLKFIKDNFTSKEDIAEIDLFIRKGLNELTNNLSEFNSEITVKMQLSEISEIISLSYIAKKYFNKTRQWLYARMNGNIVNGKQAKFTDKDKEIINFALKDISKKIGSISVS